MSYERAAIPFPINKFAHSKPHPAALLKACDQMNVKPENCLYVGDAQNDILAATAANMPSIIAAYGYIQNKNDIQHWGANGHINHPQELLNQL